MDESFRFPGDWHERLQGEPRKPYWKTLQQFVAKERAEHQVFPPEEDVLNALRYTAFADVRVLLLGQDPYHDDGQAHGLCFSVRPGVKPPPSLRNIFKELHDDCGCTIPSHGNLEHWTRQGVLMLNAVLTVRAHEPGSHAGKGWELLTDEIIRVVSAKTDPVVFLLWGGYARKKAKLVDTKRHGLVEGAHPSPLSAKKFMGSKPFSKVNAELKARGRGEIDWQIPPL
jgi:uracil-DNA glycosylase